ncbi:methionine--tRNA ligase, cytoplasmic isoform X2 [Patella vulgata]|uniref:methionine--tRNA ligase, cytoplasmic isoform X2 n=1 Tax=Patella vulgata TaxID=6465 RepID=UPI0021802D5D|nr:methionine--tRNA ligase, cytoplasmic isoform X2 [Patella vulgata]
MKIISDRGNFQSIKLLIAAKTSCIDVKFTVVKPNELIVPYLTEHKLPILEVKPDKYLFSVNAAVRLLLTSTGIESNSMEIDEWLEWESSQLLPCVLSVLFGMVELNTKNGKHPESVLQPILNHLNLYLHNRKYIVGDKLSSADVAIFGTVYPLMMALLLKDFSNITSWSQRLLTTSSFQDAVFLVTNNEGPSCFKVTKALTEEEIDAAFKSWKTGDSHSTRLKDRNHPILPKEGERNLLIASALPYVNNVPHLGNIIGCVLSADVFSRYCRQRNYNCVYICGTDEYGTATENKAMEEGLTPQQVCDKYNKLHTQIYDWFNISFDYFGRTTTKEQTKIVQDIFWKVYNEGYVMRDSVDQLHCEKCQRFLADRFVNGICPMCSYDDARGDQCDRCGKLINAVELIHPKCKTCKSTPTVKSTEHLFLDLPKLEPQLRNHLDKVFESGIWTHNAKVITNSWIRDGLKPRCITRDLKWGIPVPLEGYTDKVFYVWFDAPIGYISITANYTQDWQQWWKNPQNVELYNFLGKDNVPFHSVIFPCTLLGANDNFTLVHHMVATEYLNYEDTKFSKSRGTGVFGNNAKDTGIPADIFRFYLLFVRPESQDTAFSWDDFLLKNNSELLNNLGNFVNRGLAFVSSSFGGVIQEIHLTENDIQTVALINRELQTYINNMENTRLRDSIRNILNISRLGNQMMQSNKPWVLVKGTAEEIARAGSVVSLAANICCLLSVLLHPYMPTTSDTIRYQLNIRTDDMVIHQHFISTLKPGHEIGKPSPLFQKIEVSTIADLKEKYKGKQSAEKVTQPKTDKSIAMTVGISEASDSEIVSLTDEATKQGDVVRVLKSQKAEKSKIDVEVAKLIDLKKRLSLAQGIDPTTANKKKGKKK